MRIIFILTTLLFWGTPAFAQQPSESLPITISYFSQAGYQPGAKLGTSFSLKNWETEAKQHTKWNSFYVSPQIGFYVYPNVHTSYIVNADLGFKRTKSHNNLYGAFSIGLGYMNQSQITDWKVSLNNGNKEKIRENWNWFVPSLNYEFGKAMNSKIGWFSKWSYGHKMAAGRENSGIFLLEIGMRFNNPNYQNQQS